MNLIREWKMDLYRVNLMILKRKLKKALDNQKSVYALVLIESVL